MIFNNFFVKSRTYVHVCFNELASKLKLCGKIRTTEMVHCHSFKIKSNTSKCKLQEVYLQNNKSTETLKEKQFWLVIYHQLLAFHLVKA